MRWRFGVASLINDIPTVHALLLLLEVQMSLRKADSAAAGHSNAGASNRTIYDLQRLRHPSKAAILFAQPLTQKLHNLLLHKKKDIKRTK